MYSYFGKTVRKFTLGVARSTESVITNT